MNKSGEMTVRVLKNVSVDELAGSLGKAAKQPIEYIPIDQARQMAADELVEKDKAEMELGSDAQ
jgi:hypothetical protein